MMSNSRLLARATALAATAVLAASAASVQAQSEAKNAGPYVSLGVAHASSNADELGDFKETSAHVQMRLGYAVNRYLAVEGEGSIAALKPDVSGPDFAVRLTLERYAAAFAVARLPVSDRFAIHGRAGYHVSKVALAAAGARETESFDDFAFGFGASYRWDRNAIRADYTVLKSSFDEGGGESLNHSVAGLSFVRSF